MRVAAILFILMYILMIALPKYRVYYVLSVAVIYIALGILPVSGILSAINWNVLMMITGTMLVVYYFIESMMPNLIAGKLLTAAGNVMWVTIYMSLFAGIISAFIDNVATVLMVAPVGFVICKKLNISPVPMIVSIAVSSNLQGAATLVGDTTSILLAVHAGMDFSDFFWMHGRPGIFFAVELGALATVPIMMFLFRKDKYPVGEGGKVEVKSILPTVLLFGLILLLIIASFFKNKPALTNGYICLSLGLVAIVWNLIRGDKAGTVKGALGSIDKETLILLASLFIVIEGVTRAGIIDLLSKWIVEVGGGNKFLMFTMIVWGSVIISAFVDNIPYVATMLPVLAGVVESLGVSPELLYFGLLTGATLGGNLTPIGASANITAVGMLKKNGYNVSFKDFMRIGVPFTLTAVAVGYLVIWFVWR